MSKFVVSVFPENLVDEMKQIQDSIALDYLYGKSLYFFFTSNGNRSKLENYSEKFNNSCFIGSKRINNPKCAHFKNMRHWIKRFIKDTTFASLVFSFANLKRMQEIHTFLKDIEYLHQNGIYTSAPRVFIYLDDIKEYFSTEEMQYMIYLFTEISLVQKVICVSSTVPTNIIQSAYSRPYKYLQNVSLNEHYPNFQEMENYFSLSEHEFVFPPSYNLASIDNSISTEMYATQVLQFFPKEFFSYGKKTFVPASIDNDSHHDIGKSILMLCPFAVVVVLNHQKKSIYYTSEVPNLIHSIELKNNNYIPVLREFNLEGRPFFLTGYIHLLTCPQITNQEFGSFTGSIISHYNLHEKHQDKLYKLASKTTGHLKNWPTFQKTKIYCPPIVKEIVTSVEKYSFETFNLSSFLYTQ